VPKGKDPPHRMPHTNAVHRIACSHTVYVSYVINRPDDEISTSATHEQYLVSYNFVNMMMASE